MVNVVHEPVDDEQAEMHIWPPADFRGFDFETDIRCDRLGDTCDGTLCR